MATVTGNRSQFDALEQMNTVDLSCNNICMDLPDQIQMATPSRF